MIVAVFLVGTVACRMIPGRDNQPHAKQVINSFRQGALEYYESLQHLSRRLSHLHNDSLSILAARESLTECRLKYKRIAYFIAYYFPDQELIFNGPPVAEVEAGLNEYRDPSGLQVIEAGLYSDRPVEQLLIEQVSMMQRSTQNMLSLITAFNTSSEDIWYALSIELIRVYTLYITGYDAPQLKSGIREAAVSLTAIDSVTMLLGEEPALHEHFLQATNYLQAHTDFDTFDRIYFISKYAISLQQALNAHVKTMPVNVSARSAVNFKASNLFAHDGLNINFIAGTSDTSNALLVSLGKRLFSEPHLSANGDRSCATCHSPDMFFSDRLRRNKNRELTGDLPRNTPSLLYAGYQWHQFWDGRVRTLAEQAITVLNDTMEMNSPGRSITKQLNDDTTYVSLFKKNWLKDSTITEPHVATALAAYVRTLAPFHSHFDRFMNGDATALSAAQQRGFNLFMGKALCGSCHFAPIFNGLLPPLYQTTEFEILGTPLDDNFMHLQPDTDTGHARIIPSMPQGAFKTPTVRNAAVTAPYMHNGGFKTLESVIEFYDKGGGQGLGLHVAGQTLSPAPLHLDSAEKADLRAFIESLTDE